mmetsp:Transcript_26840/g.61793  ORF Transcript_26840/g.61793 Transcript_26840/m.61793 type:complete len:319 (-) Transcript_26840:80-1036(-)
MAMKDYMRANISLLWDPFCDNITPESFRTDSQQEKAQGKSDYFLDSANSVHFFTEPGVSFDKKNRVAILSGVEGNSGATTTTSDVSRTLNKIGHGLHLPTGKDGPGGVNPFHEYTTSGRIRNLLHEIGYVDPVCPQSMYIFKQPEIGGAVTSHQDSTFLYTTPRQTCVGLWLALDDATEKNGCLWIRPGSHREPVRRKFVRNPKYFEEGQEDASKMVFENEEIYDEKNVTTIEWEGSIPGKGDRNSLLDAEFVPVPVNAGTVVVFPGTADHLSLPNHSGKQRHTFQLHCVEGPGGGVEWSTKNWLQYPKEDSFMKIKR